MGAFADERRSIESRFSTQWGATTPVKYENVEFLEPSNANWVALTIVNGDAIPLTLAAGETERHEGVIIVQVFTLKEKGTNQGKLLADQVAGVFRMAKFSTGDSGDIICKIPSLFTVGIREGWHQVNVRIPFTRLKAYGA